MGARLAATTLPTANKVPQTHLGSSPDFYMGQTETPAHFSRILASCFPVLLPSCPVTSTPQDNSFPHPLSLDNLTEKVPLQTSLPSHAQILPDLSERQMILKPVLQGVCRLPVNNAFKTHGHGRTRFGPCASGWHQFPCFALSPGALEPHSVSLACPSSWYYLGGAHLPPTYAPSLLYCLQPSHLLHTFSAAPCFWGALPKHQRNLLITYYLLIPRFP